MIVKNKLNYSGIYTITNTTNNKIYIGSSKSLQKRKQEHFLSLYKNTHSNVLLQKTYNKYGKDSLVFEPLHECLEEDLLHFEYYWINLLNTLDKNFGYNIKHPLHVGYKHTEESKYKMIINKKPYKHSEEIRKKISESNKGKRHSKETIEKLIKIKIGRVNSEKTREKIKLALTGGKTKKGKTVFLFNENGEYINSFNNISRFLESINRFSRPNLFKLLSSLNITPCSRIYKNMIKKYNYILSYSDSLNQNAFDMFLLSKNQVQKK